MRAHGQARIAAIDFVAAAVTLGEAAFGTLIGPGFLDHWYEAVGHTAHLEQPERFNRELAALTRRVSS